MAINHASHNLATLRRIAGVLVLGLLLASDLWAGPKIESWQTEKGVRVLFVPAPELPMVDIRVLFDAGSARDGDKPGLARLTSALLTQGAGEWNADQIAERLENVGADLDVGSERDMAWASVRTLTEKAPLDTAVATMAAIIAAPRFEQADIERLREAMQVGLRQQEQSPGDVAAKAFFTELFVGHPYAGHPEGTESSLAALSRADLQGLHQRYYVARNAVVAIVGAVSRSEAEQLAERVTAGLAEGEPAAELPPVAQLQNAQIKRISFPSAQSHILIGQPGMSRHDPDYFVLYVGNHVLGGSGLVSLLSEEVREKRGLSYSVYSYFQPMRRLGPFIIGAQTQNAKAGETLAVITAALQRFVEKGPSEEELVAAKQNITGGFPLRIASNRRIVEYLAMMGFYDLPLDYLDRFVERVNAVTREQIQDAFQRRVHPDKMVTIVVGNGNEAARGEQ